MSKKNIKNMSMKELKNSKEYKKLSKKCQLSNLKKIELINILNHENKKVVNNNPSYNILYDFNNFDLKSAIKIGQGGFGQVYVIKNKNNKKKYIIKVVNKKDSELVIQEMDILNKISDNCKQYFICYSGYSYNKKNIYLITEFIGNTTDLSDYLYEKKNKLTDIMLLYILKQIVLGFIELHKEKVVHRDIKPENILFTDNQKIKIIDYGFSCIEQNKLCYNKYQGSHNYMAPEIVKSTVSDFNIAKATDIWSIGIIAYYLFNNQKYPWNRRFSRDDILDKLENLKEPIKSKKFGNIINPMLVINPYKRKKNFNKVLIEIDKEIKKQIRK